MLSLGLARASPVRPAPPLPRPRQLCVRQPAFPEGPAAASSTWGQRLCVPNCGPWPGAQMLWVWGFWGDWHSRRGDGTRPEGAGASVGPRGGRALGDLFPPLSSCLSVTWAVPLVTPAVHRCSPWGASCSCPLALSARLSLLPALCSCGRESGGGGGMAGTTPAAQGERLHQSQGPRVSFSQGS